MGKLKEIDLKRPHQEKVYRFACKELGQRNGGIVMADGVGLGKTYEALASVASLLARKQHGKIKKTQQFKVLIIVPPGLVSKWAEELDKFPEKYLKGWKSPSTKGVVETFRDVVILSRSRHLEKKKRTLRYGKGVMPSGIYIMNSNLLSREGKKVTAFRRTNWDAIVIDEAHHLNVNILKEILASKNTAIFLLTATPFQLSPREMKDVLTATYGGLGIEAAYKEAGRLYNKDFFVGYRKSLNNYFQSGLMKDVKDAERLRPTVSHILRHRIIRNKKQDNRLYHLVNESGNAKPLHSSPFSLDDSEIDRLFREKGIIGIDKQFAQNYLRIRSRISASSSRKKQTFTAVALRQLLSSWGQFKNSASGKFAEDLEINSSHPKVDALVKLVSNLVNREIKLSKTQGFIGKILIFTTYVGAERGTEVPSGDKIYGTARVLKEKIRKEVNKLFGHSGKTVKQKKEKARNKLFQIISKYGVNLKPDERKYIKNTVSQLVGSRVASHLLLANEHILKKEAVQLKHLLKRVESTENIAKNIDEEKRLRQYARRELRVNQIIKRYSTRQLVARYDGAIRQEEKDRHLHGFNSPFAPLVLIASSVGQEGIDLQKYCHHVIHYDLEWNPAKLEQREGRVDREGRETKCPINVYFLICRSTYDERMFHVMVNRQRWHRVLLGNRTALDRTPDRDVEASASEATIRKLCLNLEPRL
jgi:superfamily II DNA or RNA helicase